MSDENTTPTEAEPTLDNLYPDLAEVKFKFLCMADGEPCKVDAIELVETTDNDGNQKLAFSLTGVATHYLKTERNPGAGANPLPKTLGPDHPFDVRIPLEANADLSITLKNLNAAFEFDPPLDEGVDEETGAAGVDRFFADHPDSVVEDVRKKGIYISLGIGKLTPDKKNAGKYYTPPIYYNIRPVSKRTKVDTKGLWEKLKQKRLKASESPI